VRKIQGFGVRPEGNEVSPSTTKSGFHIRWASIAIISAILTLSGWALSSPIGSSPDDDYHLPSIWCGQGFRDGLCEKDTSLDLVQVPYTTFSNSVCYQFNENQSGACPYDSSLAAFSRSNLLNTLYPPVYYWSMSWFASEDIAASTIAMRIVNSILAVIGFTVLILALPHHFRRIPIVTLVMTSLPLGVFLIASTNPSSWAYFAMIIFFSSFLAFLSAEKLKDKSFLGLIAVSSLFLASGARPDASIYAVIAIGVATMIQLSRKTLSLSNFALSGTLLLIAAVFYFSVGTGPAIIGGALSLPEEESSAPSFFVNLASLPNLWIGVFGTSGLGWLDTEMPAIVWAVTLSIFTGLIFTSVRWFSLQQAVAVSTVFLALVAIPLYILTVSGLSVGQQVQPRYLLPLIALLGAAALFRKSSTTGLELTRGQAWIIGAGLFIANTVSLHLNARRYITGMDQQGVDLNKDIEWWWSNFPLSPNVVTLSASFAFAVFLVALWKLRVPLGLPGITQENEIRDESSARSS
jgi:hypothetical protein